MSQFNGYTTKAVGLLGVPSSAGAHFPGQEKAPQALRNAGLIAEFQKSGVTVRDHGDLPMTRFAPDPINRRAKNAAAVRRVAEQVRDAILPLLAAGELPLILGGDCSISVGVASAFTAHHENLAVLYFDGHSDLNTPETSPSGILDSMALGQILDQRLVGADDAAVFGFNPLELNPCEVAALEQRNIAAYPQQMVRDDPRTSARRALKRFAGRPFLVHFDFDVVDFPDLPLANIPQFTEGLPFTAAMAALHEFVADPHFAGLVITEVNPDHGDAGDVRRLVQGLAGCFCGSA